MCVPDRHHHVPRSLDAGRLAIEIDIEIPHFARSRFDDQVVDFPDPLLVAEHDVPPADIALTGRDFVIGVAYFRQ